MIHVHLNPIGGVAGDMFAAAFIDAGIVSLSELEQVVQKVLPHIQLKSENQLRSEISGQYFQVISNGKIESPEYPHGPDHHHHEHYHYSDIIKKIKASPLSSELIDKIESIFFELAKAEGKIHDKDPANVAFHEVGRDDAIADIVCAAYIMLQLRTVKVSSDPIPLGNGFIHFSHGKMPVPAPATAELLKEAATFSGYGTGEMTTPTGAAILKVFVDEYGVNAPAMTTTHIGYGHGSKDFKDLPNTLRVLVGHPIHQKINRNDMEDEVFELVTNIDDHPSHLIAPTREVLLKAGALDVFVKSYQAKKGRMGEEWTVISPLNLRESLTKIMLSQLGTIGVRYRKWNRTILKREPIKISYKGEEVLAKKVWGMGIERIYPEIDEVHRIAEKFGENPATIYNNLM